MEKTFYNVRHPSKNYKKLEDTNETPATHKTDVYDIEEMNLLDFQVRRKISLQQSAQALEGRAAHR